jgi:hypothetical protein
MIEVAITSESPLTLWVCNCLRLEENSVCNCLEEEHFSSYIATVTCFHQIKWRIACLPQQGRIYIQCQPETLVTGLSV